MKYLLAVLLFAFSMFVIIFGEVTQIGLLFSLLLLLGLIALFSHYAYAARKVTKERDDLREVIYFADQKTQFISNLEKEKSQLDPQSQDSQNYVKFIGVLKSARSRVGEKSKSK